MQMGNADARDSMTAARYPTPGTGPSQWADGTQNLREQQLREQQQHLYYPSATVSMMPGTNQAIHGAEALVPVSAGQHGISVHNPATALTQPPSRSQQDMLLLKAQRDRELMRLQLEHSQATSQANLQYLLNARRNILIQNALQEDQQYQALLNANSNASLMGLDPSYNSLLQQQQRMLLAQLPVAPTSSVYTDNLALVRSMAGQAPVAQVNSSALPMLNDESNASNVGMISDGTGRSQPESRLVHSSVNASTIPLGTEEDSIWLSDFLCYVRSHCVEVFTASQSDVLYRRNSKKIAKNQVGIRCKFCCHLPHSERGGRSSSFPSSISRIYQSFTMMIRDHFSTCKEMPPHEREQYNKLKNTTTKGAMESKKYWVDSAESLGMVDTGNGIFFKKHLSTCMPASEPLNSQAHISSVPQASETSPSQSQNIGI